MKPLLKYPGGKESELKYVIERLPHRIDNYYEPFLGGGAVFFGLDLNNHSRSFLNDISNDLISFYNYISQGNTLFFYYLNDFVLNFEYLSEVVDKYYRAIYKKPEKIMALLNPDYSAYVLSALNDKIKRMQKLEQEKGMLSETDIKDNLECGIKQGYYYFIRKTYNAKIKYNVFDEKRAAMFFFLREFCYSSMFRFNANGEFNVPYGGISYNRKDFKNKVNYLKSKEVYEKVKKAKIEKLDFKSFLEKYPPKENDFIFLDPPYDSDFSDYDNNCFNTSDQKRLASYLINDCKGKWLMIVKSTPLILSLYKPGKRTANKGKVRVEGFDKKYSVSFKNRNLKNCEHLIITNYELLLDEVEK